MASVPSLRRRAAEPIPLESRAFDHLRYIRETMERAGSFTAVPGWGGVAMGATAVIAALVASWQISSRAWLGTWLMEGMVATLVGLLAMRRKAQAAGLELWSAPARKFAFSFLPPIAAGAALTVALWHAGMFHLVPGVWLVLYGCGVITGGAFSVKIVPAMGACFLILGTIALLTAEMHGAWGDLWLGMGFGALHMIFGTLIAKRYGG